MQDNVNDKRTDVVVIGAGPVGIACAVEAQRVGLSCVVLEKGSLVNSLIGYPTNMQFFSTPQLLEIGDYPFPTLRYKPLREDGIDYYRSVAAAEDLDVRLHHRVTGLSGESGSFRVETDRGDFESAFVIVATGFFDLPNLLNVPGEELPHVSHYYKEPFGYAMQDVVIIGAKNSAAKAALECYRYGARVTLLVRGPAVSDSVKYWIKPDLENRIKGGEIKAHFNVSIESIDADHVHFLVDGSSQSVHADVVFALTGYLPDFTLLERMGIGFADDPAKTPLLDAETNETSRPGVYMAGTVCGGRNTSRWFIENGRHHAKAIAADMKTKVEAGVSG